MLVDGGQSDFGALDAEITNISRISSYFLIFDLILCLIVFFLLIPHFAIQIIETSTN